MIRNMAFLRQATLLACLSGIVISSCWLASDNSMQMPRCWAAEAELEQNAYVYYGKAAREIQGKRSELIRLSTDHELTRARQLLHDNERALSLLRQGLTLPYQPTRSLHQLMFYADTLEIDYEFVQAELLVRLLRVEAHVAASDGDHSRAVNALISGVKLGGDLSRSGWLSDYEAGLVIQRMSLLTIWDSVQRLDEQSATITLRILEEHLREPFSYVDAIRSEVAQIKAAYQLITDEEWEALIEDGVPDRATLMKHTDNYHNQYLRIIERQPGNVDSFQHFVQTMSFIAENDKLELGFVTSFYPRGFNSDRFIRILYSDAFVRTQLALLTTSLALQAYHTHHGEYPNTLDVLVPQFIAQIPHDPFRPDQHLQYRHGEAQYCLYSVGPDGVDNGGEAVSSQTHQHLVSMTSIGDIVAGVNRGSIAVEIR